jgi:hypothetical protein
MGIDQLYYTSCARDQGREGIDGFQVKASSPGISGEVEKRIRLFSERYTWPTGLDSLVRPGAMEAEEFSRFPVALHYYPLPDGRQALTRICISPVQPKRAGNFFAHTLAFPREALAPLASNPFALARSGVFRQEDESSETALSVIAGFEHLRDSDDGTSLRVVASPPYAEQAAPMLSALSSGAADRPVVVVARALEEAPSLIEGLLLLLPEQFRLGIAFCIYEPHPYRILRGAETGRPHILTTSLSADGGEFGFRPEEYEGHFYVYNFAESRFSTMPHVSAFSARVADESRLGHSEDAARVLTVLGELGLGSEPAAWDDALAAADFLRPAMGGPRPALEAAVASLVQTCSTATQAAAAVRALVEALTNESDCSPADLTKASSAMRALLERVGPSDPVRHAAATQMAELASGLLLGGNAACVRCAADALGPAGDELLGAAVERALPETSLNRTPRPAGPLAPEDAAALPGVLSGGMRALFQKTSGNEKARVLLPDALRFSERSDCLYPFWQALWAWFRPEFLDPRPWLEVAELVRRVDTAIAGQDEQSPRCPVAVLDLKLWQIESDGVPRDEKMGCLASVAAACRRTDDARSWARRATTLVASKLDDMSCLWFLECLAADRRDEVTEDARQAYDGLLKRAATREPADAARQREGKPRGGKRAPADRIGAKGAGGKGGEETAAERAWAFRTRAAKRGASHLLAMEFIGCVWPRAEADDLQQWVRRLLQRDPQVNRVACEYLAELATQGTDADSARALLSAYLCAAREAGLRLQGTPEHDRVVQALCRITPFSGLTDQLHSCLAGAKTDVWPEKDALRYELLREITAAERRRDGAPDTSFAALLAHQPRLPELLRSYYGTEPREVCAWAMGMALAGAGIANVDTVVALLAIAPEGEIVLDPEHFLAAAVPALVQVSLVKRVLALTQFVLWVQTVSGRPQSGAEHLVAALVRATDRGTRAALWAYLEERRSGAAWARFMSTLRAESESAPPRAGPDGEDQGAAEAARSGKPTLWSRVLGSLRKPGP